MTWCGYPAGNVRIYLDGDLVGDKPFDARYDDGRRLPSRIALGIRPTQWQGELVPRADGSVADLRPRTSMSLTDGGLEIKNTRLYQVTLDQEEIRQLAAADD